MNSFRHVVTLSMTFILGICIAQTPQKFNYQAVARDIGGNPMIKKAISLKLSILNGSASGSSIYSETHKVTTNDYGHFSVMVGAGSSPSSIFKDIAWDVSDKFLKIEFDAAGGSSYTNMGTVQLISVPYALNASKANSLSSSAKILLDQLDAGGAASGQVLGWDGTKWIPVAKGGSGGSDNWGTQVTQTNTTLSGDGTTANPLKLAQQGAASGQILKWNGVSWLPANEAAGGGSDNWGTQVAQTNGTLSGNGTSSSPLSIAQQSATSNQILRWDGTKWSPSNESAGADNWGTQTAVTGSTLTGNGSAGNPLNLASQSASVGQVLKWNGSGWVPKDDSTGSDNWGTQSVVADSSLLGQGTSANPLKLAQRGATSGQFLQWNGTAWVPVTASTGGDNWGSQVAQTTSNLTGTGTSSNPLKIAQQGATSGQILQWSGTDWVPATATTGGDNWGSQVTQVAASIAGNGTSANPLKIAQQSATNGQFLQWNSGSSNWVPVTLTAPNGDNWGAQSAVTGSTLTGNGTASTPLNLAQQSATVNQVLKWNGSAWVPKNDSAGGTYTGANGITITGSTIQLGGSLTGATTLTTTASNTLALAGLQSAGASDSVLTIDPSTNAIKRIDPSRLGGGQWTKDAANNLSYKNGKVSIGTDTASNPLYVYNSSAVLDTAVFINSSTSNSAGNLGLVSDAYSTSANSSVGGRFSGNGAGIVAIGRQTLSAASTITGVNAAARSTFANSRLTGVQGEADSTTNFSFGVYGQGHNFGVAGLGNFSSTTFYGSNTFPFISKYGVFGLNTGGAARYFTRAVAVGGHAENSNIASNIGTLGAANSPVGVQESIGLYGRAKGGDTSQIGLWVELDSPYRSSTLYRYAAVLLGNVFIGGALNVPGSATIGALSVTGTLSKPSGTFKIDHPQDPENKFLYHSFVESPDMMNVYNGNITTDKNGIAVVDLPAYFYTLNKDFRYQLTTISSFSPVMVKSKINESNQFVISSKEPNVEVSWQVTGIRKDPWAEKNRVIPELEKTGIEKGKYLYPELYNQPKEKGIYSNTIHSEPKLLNSNLQIQNGSGGSATIVNTSTISK